MFARPNTVFLLLVVEFLKHTAFSEQNPTSHFHVELSLSLAFKYSNASAHSLGSGHNNFSQAVAAILGSSPIAHTLHSSCFSAS